MLFVLFFALYTLLIDFVHFYDIKTAENERTTTPFKDIYKFPNKFFCTDTKNYISDRFAIISSMKIYNIHTILYIRINSRITIINPLQKPPSEQQISFFNLSQSLKC
jgi:hypothetical protein